MAHGTDAIHPEAASGLSKATALKYVDQVAELICTHLTNIMDGRNIIEGWWIYGRVQRAISFEEWISISRCCY